MADNVGATAEFIALDESGWRWFLPSGSSKSLILPINSYAEDDVLQMLVLWFIRNISGPAGLGSGVIGFWATTSIILYLIIFGATIPALGHVSLRSGATLCVILSGIAGAIIGNWSYRRRGRLVIAATDGLASAIVVCGGLLWFSVLADDQIRDLPGAIWAGMFFQGHALILGPVIFSVLWSLRVLGFGLWHLWTGPDGRTQLIGLTKGALAAVAAVGLATGIQVAIAGGFGILTATDRFYAVVVPALAAFGWFGPRPQRRSVVFAAALLWAAISAVAVAFPWPFSDGWHGVRCIGDSVGIHTVFGLGSAPWYWRYSWLWTYDPLQVMVAGPAALAELTLWHIANPAPEC